MAINEIELAQEVFNLGDVDDTLNLARVEEIIKDTLELLAHDYSESEVLDLVKKHKRRKNNGSNQ